MHGQELVVIALTPVGPREVARHALSTPGNPRIADEHYPPRPEGPLGRTPRATSPAEAEFLALGPGAERWLVTAAATGQSRIRAKMAGAVTLAKFHGDQAVAHALQACAQAERFGEADLALILAHQAQQHGPVGAGPTRVASETHTLQAGTGAWAGAGR